MVAGPELHAIRSQDPGIKAQAIEMLIDGAGVTEVSSQLDLPVSKVAWWELMYRMDGGTYGTREVDDG